MANSLTPLRATFHSLEVTVGYYSVSKSFKTQSGMAPLKVELQLELQHLVISTGLVSGSVQIDGKDVGHCSRAGGR